MPVCKLYFYIAGYDILCRYQLFEAIPPYGPSVASMIFWFSAGYVDANTTRVS